MNPSTAQDIFFALFSSLRENNFEEVGTHLISDRLNVGFYEDSSTALDELYQRAQSSDYAPTALRQLIYATRNYLRLAGELPEYFEREVQNFRESSLTPPPALNLYFENTNLPVNITGILENPSREQLQHLLNMVAEFLGNNDQDFFNNLNNNL